MKEFKDMQFHISRDTDRGLCHCACGRQDRQLNTYDWLKQTRDTTSVL